MKILPFVVLQNKEEKIKIDQCRGIAWDINPITLSDLNDNDKKLVKEADKEYLEGNSNAFLTDDEFLNSD